MIEDTLKKIEARVQASEAISDERRRELLQLLDKLKSEVADLSQTHGDQAASIAGFTDISTHEATRASQNPRLLSLSVQGLRSSVAGFEKSHPKLVQIVNTISNALSNLGI
jgi:hypothetical protein